MDTASVRHLLRHLIRTQDIMRRYFVTNGFDGALTMLGLMTGFYAHEVVAVPAAIGACLGAAVALFMSGLSSAYLTEKAERRKELQELEQSLLTSLENSHFGQASRVLPVLMALVNGLSPLVVSLLIIVPLWVAAGGVTLPVSPFLAAIIVALTIIFVLGAFLGTVSNSFWLWSGLRTLIVAAVTVAIILFFGQSPPIG